MGQQQLLLLVIGVIIVGIATVTAFYILEHSYRKDEADGLLDRSLAIATYAVYWKSKNDPFQGGNQSYEALAEGGLEMLALDNSNVRGDYAIVGASPSSVRIAGVSQRFEGIGVCVVVEGYEIPFSFVRYDGSISLDEDCIDE